MHQKQNTQNQPGMTSLLLGTGFALAQRVGLGASVTSALRGALMRAASRF